MGTSVGTITALTPVGLGIAQATSIPVPLVIGAIVGGGMFGDNLSMISDTTIAAVRTQGCELKDKFKVNFLIVLPAALLSLVILFLLTSSYQVHLTEIEAIEWVKVIPLLGDFSRGFTWCQCLYFTWKRDCISWIDWLYDTIFSVT